MGCDGADIASASNFSAALSKAAASDAFIPPRVGASLSVPHPINVAAQIDIRASENADFVFIRKHEVCCIDYMCVLFQNDQESIRFCAKKKADPHMQASLNFYKFKKL
jgi:hypothetical protein